MADWYCSSVAYNAVTQWSAALTATTGMMRRQLATPTLGNERVWRCTTGGTTGGSEPTWTLTKGSTTTDNGVVWTECTGNSGQQQNGGVTNTWTAPHKRLPNAIAWSTNGDRIFVSSDHAESQSVTFNIQPLYPSYIFSVDRTTGHIPPVAADKLAGASVTLSGANNLALGIACTAYYWGISFILGASAESGDALNIAYGDFSNAQFDTCGFTLGGTGSGAAINFYQSSLSVKARCDNCAFSLAKNDQFIRIENGRTEINNATFSGTASTSTQGLFDVLAGSVKVHASDLSGLSSSTQLYSTNSSSTVAEIEFTNCKLPSSIGLPNLDASAADQFLVRLINCDNGSTGYVNRWLTSAGTITTETTIVLTGGATDGVQGVSHKGVTNSSANQLEPLQFPVYSTWNTSTGSSKTATIEVQSNATLTNTDIWLEVEYLGDSGDPKGSVVTSRVDGPLTSGNAPSSGATWASSVGSPSYQYLQVTFTPQKVGLVRARVFLAKASQTIYVNPHVTIA